MVFLFNKLIINKTIMTYVISCYYPLEYGQTHHDAQNFVEEIIIDLVHASQLKHIVVQAWGTNEETPEDYMCYNAVRIDISLNTDCSCIRLYWSYTMRSTEEFKTEAAVLSDRLNARIHSVDFMWAQTINYMFTLKLLTHLENQGESMEDLANAYPLNLFKEDTTSSKFALLGVVHMVLNSRVIGENGNVTDWPDWSKWKLPWVHFVSPRDPFK